MVRATISIVAAAALLLIQAHASAAVLYSQDFDGVDVDSLGFSFGTLSIAASGSIINAGVNDSKAYSVPFDGSSPSPYQIAFGKMNAPQASDANPLGAGLISSPSQIRFSLDVRVKGSLVPNPVLLGVRQIDSSYEQTHGIDANGDGDMVDSATNYESLFKPTLVDGAGFAHVQFTLNQGLIRSSIVLANPCCSNIPLIPIFDPTVSLQWIISFGSGAVVGDAGFGLDAGNSVTVDNILIEAVPEPAAISLYIMGIAAIAALRPRRGFPR